MSKVRVISETGEQLGILSTRDALERARNDGLDLVEMAPNAKPPVCKILDYGKYLYQQQKKEQQAKKKQHVSELKEVRMRPKTDKHDIEIKVKKAREFLEDGCKVQFTMVFRGREQLYRDIGRETLQQIATELSEISKIERETRVEGRRMILILTPTVVAKKAGGKPRPEDDGKPSPEDEQSALETDALSEFEEMSPEETSSTTGTDNGNA